VNDHSATNDPPIMIESPFAPCAGYDFPRYIFQTKISSNYIELKISGLATIKLSK
jgi:hypothetical protein